MLCCFVIARRLWYTGKVRNQLPVCTIGTAIVLSKESIWVYVHLTVGAQCVVVITPNKIQGQSLYAKEKWLRNIATCRPSNGFSPGKIVLLPAAGIHRTGLCFTVSHILFTSKKRIILAPRVYDISGESPRTTEKLTWESTSPGPPGPFTWDVHPKDWGFSDWSQKHVRESPKGCTRDSLCNPKITGKSHISRQKNRVPLGHSHSQCALIGPAKWRGITLRFTLVESMLLAASCFWL